jgi:uncharacterized protein YodC (DUF2158 family)
MAERFKPGDVVRLKSGGPGMTVVTLDRFGGADQKYKCRWFDAKNVLEDALFTEAELTAVESDSGSGGGNPTPPRSAWG